ncbi:TIGR03619 family F420-dependent LLM class oxidoreductase [Mycobacterium colombiense]|uniref:TIGR03619 family F420-dependent LLM class oxidoreductase n=1 Tax=Mycobacterium colombiense TaxID=339268 RepID=UPI0034640623
MARVGLQAEECGFSAIALSDHPAPSAKWHRNGGHDTVDPAVALAYLAAVTVDVRLMTNLYVLPFRNPYLTAKALTTLDVVSGGRLIAGVGAGYLRSEFSALGRSFDERAGKFDESLDALVRIWTNPVEPVTGGDFAATGPMQLDPPLQRPHPPLWIGGNSNAALRRVVRYGQGWSPVVAPPALASSIRTAPIEGREDFGRAAERLRDRLESAGRDPDAVDIQIPVQVVDFRQSGAVAQLLDELGEMQAHGATWAIVHVDASSVEGAVDYLNTFADNIIRARR